MLPTLSSSKAPTRRGARRGVTGLAFCTAAAVVAQRLRSPIAMRRRPSPSGREDDRRRRARDFKLALAPCSRSRVAALDAEPSSSRRARPGPDSEGAEGHEAGTVMAAAGRGGQMRAGGPADPG
jgi:hypothetical protein